MEGILPHCTHAMKDAYEWVCLFDDFYILTESDLGILSGNDRFCLYIALKESRLLVSFLFSSSSSSSPSPFRSFIRSFRCLSSLRDETEEADTLMPARNRLVPTLASWQIFDKQHRYFLKYFTSIEPPLCWPEPYFQAFRSVFQ